MRFSVLLSVVLLGLAPVVASAEVSPERDVRIFFGDEKTAYRDPTAIWHDGTLHLYCTVVTAEADGRIFSFVAHSSTRDLRVWTPPARLTKLDQTLNFSSPGNVFRVGDDWAMCVSSYPRPGYRLGDPVRYGDKTARVWLMRSKDLVTWGEPEILRVKGNVAVSEMGRMIDPYLIEDAAEPGKWWCFYKQNGVSRSWSRDLRHWTPAGSAPAGENVCILREKDGYVMFHSPRDGIGVKRSPDLLNWRDEPSLELPRDGWEWAKGRLTAGFVLDARTVPQIGCYILFFHGSGPKSEPEGDFDRNASVAMLFSDDLRVWRSHLSVER